MRTVLLAAAITAALVIPVVAYREPPVPLATQLDEQALSIDMDPVLDMAANGCQPTTQEVEGGATLIRLCPNAR
jgi:hypothetical protein